MEITAPTQTLRIATGTHSSFLPPSFLATSLPPDSQFQKIFRCQNVFRCLTADLIFKRKNKERKDDAQAHKRHVDA